MVALASIGHQAQQFAEALKKPLSDKASSPHGEGASLAQHASEFRNHMETGNIQNPSSSIHAVEKLPKSYGDRILDNFDHFRGELDTKSMRVHAEFDKIFPSSGSDLIHYETMLLKAKTATSSGLATSSSTTRGLESVVNPR